MAVGITLFIGLLQIGFIRPYYRNSKIRAISSVATKISDDLIMDGTSNGIQSAMRETIENNVCAVMYNDDGRQVYSADSLGVGCVFSVPSAKKPVELQSYESMRQTLQNSNETYSLNSENPITGDEMIVYGTVVHAPLSNYYLFLNSPLEPVDSITTFYFKQYFLYTLLAIGVASLFAFYISKKITRPIINMKAGAKKLAAADYSATFDGGSFTETRELAQALNEANSKLSKIETLRRDLIANVSHDIRTPLTDIRAYAEMIRDISGDRPEKRNKHLDVIIRETEYMSRLINDMSELSRMQTGNYEVFKENIDFADKVREIVDLNASVIERAGVKVVVEVPDSLTVYADDVKMGQVISNYLTNAIKHTPAGKKIFVRAYMLDDDTIRFEVEDEGEGIPKDELPYIWDRYQKSSRSYSRNMTSTGLGLAIVKAIADTHHAKYGVKSEVGKGSIFWFELGKTDEE